MCVFKRGAVLVLVYVDDVLVIAPTEGDIKALNQSLKKTMPTQDVGPAEHFLGVDTRVSRGTVCLKQSKGIEALLTRTRMKNARPISCPLEPTTDYSATDGAPSHAVFPFRSIIGSILYLSMKARPDLSTAINLLARHVTKPTLLLERGLLRLLKCLNSTKSTSLQLTPGDSTQLSAYVDANWASESGSRRK